MLAEIILEIVSDLICGIILMAFIGFHPDWTPTDITWSEGGRPEKSGPKDGRHN